VRQQVPLGNAHPKKCSAVMSGLRAGELEENFLLGS
jgi:hypothetical protein